MKALTFPLLSLMMTLKASFDLGSLKRVVVFDFATLYLGNGATSIHCSVVKFMRVVTKPLSVKSHGFRYKVAL